MHRFCSEHFFPKNYAPPLGSRPACAMAEWGPQYLVLQNYLLSI
uniref:Uncharacterized protein n=1 Tax=Curvibacter symbiont subsp. Hydra magnipapillata TaxID=667019 RepID=C9YFS7_CURXX|nr:hypothetical protein Csp_B16270 [Curvibacter putative symbiont of Hydra magnipapillata]